ncbi:hypothetical protein [Halococcoides cellulosivorans]|uniref:Uncharacterized protein n=1 Tax=Halococcoides cellulosivorans TaxID=1679096 RepID=A0A2R4X1N4_9EURY|nr:hypothetical protein [Halococcoides cellulosivorans]AWB27709.1 hypothetical protein HARCEL1_08300 [Halococcoides cellulosivorans]
MPSGHDSTRTAEVSGVFLDAIPTTLDRACGSCHTVVSSILAAEAVADPVSTDWYPLADGLAVYDRIEADVGRYTLFRIGRGLARSMDWPPEIATIDDALPLLADQYDRYHRGTESWAITLESDQQGTGKITFKTPYPRVLEAGLVRGVDDQFGTEDTYLAVRRGPCEECLSVRWWDEEITHVDRLVPRMTRGDDLDPDLRRASRAGTPASR